jgi:CCR4-NOT transcriptional regulation complex NOT5 subunit
MSQVLTWRSSLYESFSSPWADNQSRRGDFMIPNCYTAGPPAQLRAGHFSRFLDQTLLYIFYTFSRDQGSYGSSQIKDHAAAELCTAMSFPNSVSVKRNWRYSQEHKLWFIRDPNNAAEIRYFDFSRSLPSNSLSLFSFRLRPLYAEGPKLKEDDSKR